MIQSVLARNATRTFEANCPTALTADRGDRLAALASDMLVALLSAAPKRALRNATEILGDEPWSARVDLVHAAANAVALSLDHLTNDELAPVLDRLQVVKEALLPATLPGQSAFNRVMSSYARAA